MNKLVAPLAVLAFAFTIAVAQADQAAGKIAAVDPATGTLVLEDGTIFLVAQDLAMDGLKPGADVMIVFEEQGGQLIATEIAPAN